MEIIIQTLELLDTCQAKITDQEATIKADIHKSKAQPQEKKTQLIGQLHQLAQSKLASLAAQKNQLETTRAQLESCLDFMKKNMETVDQYEVLETKNSVIKQSNKLTTPFPPELLKPCTEADLKGEL